jgi:hypothetical protein
MFGKYFVASLMLIFLAAVPASAECLSAEKTSKEVMAQKMAHYEEGSSFVSLEASRESMRTCLSALEGIGVTVSPSLLPMPDLLEVTERLCRAGRRTLLDQIPTEPAALPQAGGLKGYRRKYDIGLEVRDALK